jgi:hypothetical protein
MLKPDVRDSGSRGRAMTVKVGPLLKGRAIAERGLSWVGPRIPNNIGMYFPDAQGTRLMSQVASLPLSILQAGVPIAITWAHIFIVIGTHGIDMGTHVIATGTPARRIDKG